MGGFWKYLPFELFSLFICLFNLSGLPFSIGFYIKHLLLVGSNLNIFVMVFVFINIFIGALSGLVYSYRLYFYVFFDFKKGRKSMYVQSNRIKFKSINYSNTTLMSNLAIIFLIITSYIISVYLFNIFLNTSSLGEGLEIYSVHSSQFFQFNNLSNNFSDFFSYINWIIIYLIFIVFCIRWRRYNYNNTFRYVFVYLNIFIFFFI